jgi:hypothetical protein
VVHSKLSGRRRQSTSYSQRRITLTLHRLFPLDSSLYLLRSLPPCFLMGVLCRLPRARIKTMER